MIKLLGDVLIDRPLDMVFGFLTRIENYPSWQPGIREAQQLSPGSVGVGTDLRIVFVGPGNQPMEARARVTEYDPGRRFAYETTSGPAKIRGFYQFRSDGQRTHADIRTEVQLTGGLRLVEGLVAGQIEEEFRASLLRLKRVLEAHPAG